MPRWIDQQASKAERQRRAKEAHDAAVRRHMAEAKDREAFRREQDRAKAAAERALRPPRAIRPGTMRRPDFTDEELADALGCADPRIPRHLRYPHLLTLRERGFTRMVFADDGSGEFGVPSYRGDVITDVGLSWLRTHTGGE